MLPSYHNIKFWICCQVQEWPSQHQCWYLKSPTYAFQLEVPVPSELVLLMELMSFLNCSSKTLGSSFVRSSFLCSPWLHRLFFNLFSSCRHELSFTKVVCYGPIVLSSFPRSSSNSWWAIWFSLRAGAFCIKEWARMVVWWSQNDGMVVTYGQTDWSNGKYIVV